jgi:tagaturonate reductase
MVDSIEEEISTKIIKRTHRGIEPENEKIIQKLEKICFIQEDIMDIAKNAGKKLTIGTYASLAKYVLPEITKKFRKENPGMQINIIVTDNLEMYRTRKVRILNGAHTSMIPYAMLEGVETVKDCMENEKLFAFVNACVFEEIIPTLDLPEEELVDYANNVFERFRNPYIKHLCASISLNSVSKFKVRVLPSLLQYIARFNKDPENLIFSLAKLIEFYKNGNPNDDAEVIEFIKTRSIKEILANQKFWGQDISFLTEKVEKVCKA